MAGAVALRVASGMRMVAVWPLRRFSAEPALSLRVTFSAPKLSIGVANPVDHILGETDPVGEVVAGGIVHRIHGHGLTGSQIAERIDEGLAGTADAGCLVGTASEDHLHVGTGFCRSGGSDGADHHPRGDQGDGSEKPYGLTKTHQRTPPVYGSRFCWQLAACFHLYPRGLPPKPQPAWGW